jgi:hypothetical protein
LVLLASTRFLIAHYQNYLFPVAQHKTRKTPVTAVFCYLMHKALEKPWDRHGTDPARTTWLQPL